MGLVNFIHHFEVSAFQRFGQNFQFLNFLPFYLLHQDMQTFSQKKSEEIGYI